MKALRTGATLCALVAALGACRDGGMTGEDASTPRDSGGRRDTGMMVEDDAAVGEDAGGDDGGGSDDSAPVATDVTLRALQDLTNASHPMNNARVNLVDTDLVALTGRVLIGSRTDTSCRFAFWVGKANGDFSGIQVQELINRGTASDCFAVMARKIPMDLQPGARIASITNANFGEFCSGPTGSMAGMCRNFEQSQLFLGAANATVTVMGAGTAPTPASVSVGDLVAEMGAPGARALNLEGSLVKVSNVRVYTYRPMGSMFDTYALVASDDTGNTKQLDLIISNFPRTSCARSFVMSRGTGTIASVSGILMPNFGRWSLRLRDERDLEGVACASDGGM